MKKIVIGTSLALATLLASPAFAATHHARVSAQQPYADDSAYDANASAGSGSPASGPAVYSFGHYAGWDPDPAIRFQLMRDPDLAD